MALALLLAGACVADARPTFVVRDSAGIAIAENADTAPAIWTMAAAAAVEIGADADDPAEVLAEVGGVTRLSDGRLVLTDGGTAELRVYDPTGRRIMTAGGQGEGPGEFRSVSRPYRLAGDSVLVCDGSLGRISVFDSALRLARQFRLDPAPAGESVSPVLLSGGSEILARPGFVFGRTTPNGLYRREIRYERFRLDGTHIDSPGDFPGDEMFVFGGGGNSMAGSMPFHRRSLLAATSDGFVFGAAEQYEIERHARDGRLLALIRVRDRVVPFTAERKKRFRDEFTSGGPDDQRQFFERLLKAIPLPDAFPAYTRLIVDADGYLWVRDFTWGEESVNWRVFAPDGRLTASLETPASFQVFEIGRDWMLGIRQDDLGVESVRMYGLERAES